MMRNKLFKITLTPLLLAALTSCQTLKSTAPPKYQATWNSLQKHQTPQWLLDAKFGIYTHVTLQTVKNIPGNENKHKHELIEDFTLNNFNAGEWADLFKQSGAKFAGPVAWHGSGFLHWDSELTAFNAKQMGPKVDLLAELKKEIYARDMKFITSFHTGYWYHAAIDQQNPGRFDPQYADLYGPVHDQGLTDIIPWKNHIEKQQKYNQEFLDTWLARMKEAVTKYQPDIAWVDTSFGGTTRSANKGRFVDGKHIIGQDPYFNGVKESHQRQYIAHLFNTADQYNKDVAFVYKEHDVPPGIGMRNFENGLIDKLSYDPWMTDIDLSDPVSWFYKEGMGIKSANLIIDMLADVTSKNGILLLNVPPKPDGTFSEAIKNELYEIGRWLDVNGEAIYNTMPWAVYGEGPSSLPLTGHYSESKHNASYTKDDYRFTQNGDYLYAICLGTPTENLSIEALGSRGRLYEGDILSIELVGSNEKIHYQHTPMALNIALPKHFPTQHASVFRILRKK